MKWEILSMHDDIGFQGLNHLFPFGMFKHKRDRRLFLRFLDTRRFWSLGRFRKLRF
jgi:hypothetical protein